MIDDTIESRLAKVDINEIDKGELIKIIEHIYNHEEFKERCTNKFLHHSNVTLGDHIIEDAILTYKMSKEHIRKNIDGSFRIDLAVKIAMFHDLYTVPWQNNSAYTKEKFFNRHGFRHPVEAAINAYTWFKDDFDDRDAPVLIDGIIHHMYPFPVLSMDNAIVNNRELNNFAEFQKLPDEIKELIYESTNRNKFLGLSWSKCKYKEGIIMSKADKKVTKKELKNVPSILALITGKNKTIK